MRAHCGAIWVALVVCFTAACAGRQTRFVDVRTPQPQLVEHLKRKAAHHNTMQAARTTLGVASAKQHAQGNKLSAAEAVLKLRDLRDREKQLMRQRHDLARAMRRAFHAYGAPCRKFFSLQKTQERCDRLEGIVALAKTTQGALAQRLGLEPPPKQPGPAPTTAVAWPTVAPGEAPAAAPYDPQLTIDEARQLLTRSSEEREVAIDIADWEKRKDDLTAGKQVEQTELSVTYDSISLKRTEHSVTAEGTASDSDTTRYRIVAVDGVTRVLSDDNFEPEVMDVLELTTGERACVAPSRTNWLTRPLRLGSPLCRSDDASTATVRTGSLHITNAPRTSKRPHTLRSIVFAGHDPRLGGVAGYGFGLRAGLELWRNRDGVGLFPRWKLATLMGADGIVSIDFSKDKGDEPRAVWSVKPELSLRVSRATTMRLTPEAVHETGHTTSIDVSLGLLFDTLSRRGLSVGTTIRPKNEGLGVYGRWDRYFRGDGDSFVGGIEFTDEAAALPVYVAGVTGGAVLTVLLFAAIFSCGFDETCGDQE